MVQPGGGLAVGRREGAPGAGHAGLAAPQPAAARRADQPPRPDDARGAVDGAQRVRRHGHAGQPRPRAAARGLRRVLARHRAAACCPSTATSTTTSAGCSRCRAPRRRGLPPPGLAAPPADGAAPAAAPPRRRRAQPRAEAAPPAASRDDRKAAKQSRAKLAEATRPLRVELQRSTTAWRGWPRRRPRSRPRWRSPAPGRRLRRARAAAWPTWRPRRRCSRSAGWQLQAELEALGS